MESPKDEEVSSDLARASLIVSQLGFFFDGDDEEDEEGGGDDVEAGDGGRNENNTPRHRRTVSFEEARSEESSTVARDNVTTNTSDADNFSDHQHHLLLQRRTSTKSAMNHGQRQRHYVVKALKAPGNLFRRKKQKDQIATDEKIETADTSSTSFSPREQHRLKISTRNMMHAAAQYNMTTDHGQGSGWQKFFRKVGVGVEYDDANGSRSLTLCGMSLDLMVTEYLHWCFRSSFAAVFLSGAVAFFAWTILFAIIIWLVADDLPSCIGGVDAESNYFMDAFALSWTTFSTVGYGLVYSGISADEPDIKKCTGITIIVSLEAFVGVLFAGFVGAIIFGKVARIQSFAQIKFSGPILVRYGKGLRQEEVMSQQQQDQDWEDEESENPYSPCPVLEFQVVNLLNDVPTGEIMDATVTVVASIDADQACHTVQKAAKKKRRKKGKKGGSKVQNRAQPRKAKGQGSGSDSEQEGPMDIAAILKSFETERRMAHQSFEEDPSGHLVPHRIFSRLEIETQEHPFFKRVWIVRHVLDESSPLLRTPARAMIHACGGLWPKELTNASGVRDAIQFDQLLVSFSGTSNADANTVYAQKVYEFDAVHVGYRFVNILHRAKNHHRYHETICVDPHLINDVVEQAGGGGEPLGQRMQDQPETITDMLVL